jgi:hypothetical protein
MRPKKGIETLVEEMKLNLPIPARLTREAQRVLDQKEMHMEPGQEVNIVYVFDSGDMAGIVCT